MASIAKGTKAASLSLAVALWGASALAQDKVDDAWLVGYGDGLYLWAWADGTYAAAHDSAEPFSGDSSGWQLGCRLDKMTDEKTCFISSISPSNELFGGLEIRYGTSSTPLAVCVQGHDFPGSKAMIRVDKLPAVETDEQGCLAPESIVPKMMFGESVLVRRVSLPNGVEIDKLLTLGGFPQAVLGLPKIQAGKLRRDAVTSIDIPEAASADVARLVENAKALDRRCRGTEGSDPASTVCAARNDAFLQANRAGMCYGKEGQAGYQMEWHSCEPDSIGRGH